VLKRQKEIHTDRYIYRIKIFKCVYVWTKKEKEREREREKEMDGEKVNA
jgi:hypothetical protein